MTKKNKTPLGIFIESVGLYFSNFNQFVKYMTFPVLGQVLGLSLTLFFTYIYSKNLPFLIDKYSIFNNFSTLVLISVVVALPGMIIFIKAFWEYLVAYGAVNSMLENMLKSGRVYDFSAHTELIKRRTSSFVGLWLILGVFSCLASFPLFWVPAGVIAVYLVLVFQVFTYEPELSPAGCIKKSFNLIKGHFFSTFMLIMFAGLLGWVLIPQIFNYVMNLAGINNFLANLISNLTEIFPLNEINGALTPVGLPAITNRDVADFFVTTTIAQIVIQYTLPLRSIMCGLWYRELNGALPAQVNSKKSSKKRPSEKLMEESHKNLSVKSKKLDRNILKRAMEKDE